MRRAPVLVALVVPACSLLAAPILQNAANDDASADASFEAPPAQCSPFDCTNPTCQALGYACVDLPPDWLYMAPGNVCPDGQAPKSYETDLAFQPASCTCPCNAPNCMTGNWQEKHGSGGCPIDGGGTAHAVGDGGCIVDLITLGGLVGTATEFDPAPPVGGGCGDASVSRPTPTTTTLNYCVAAQDTKGCAAGQVCVLQSATSCVVGSGTCPPNFQKSTVVGAQLTDTRDCACACTPECNNPKVTFYDNTCTNTAGTQNLGTCSVNGGGLTSKAAYAYSATASCSMDASSVGTVAFAAPSTLCCP